MKHDRDRRELGRQIVVGISSSPSKIEAHEKFEYLGLTAIMYRPGGDVGILQIFRYVVHWAISQLLVQSSQVRAAVLGWSATNLSSSASPAMTHITVMPICTLRERRG